MRVDPSGRVPVRKTCPVMQVTRVNEKQVNVLLLFACIIEKISLLC